MYIAGVSRDHFLTEIHLEKKIPRVHVVHTIDTDRKPALIHTVDLTNSLLEQLRRDHVAHEIEGA